MVSPASTWPPWELMNTVMSASDSAESASSWPETVAASLWVISPLMTMVRARSRRSATGSATAVGGLSGSCWRSMDGLSEVDRFEGDDAVSA